MLEEADAAGLREMRLEAAEHREDEGRTRDTRGEVTTERESRCADDHVHSSNNHLVKAEVPGRPPGPSHQGVPFTLQDHRQLGDHLVQLRERRDL